MATTVDSRFPYMGTTFISVEDSSRQARESSLASRPGSRRRSHSVPCGYVPYHVYDRFEWRSESEEGLEKDAPSNFPDNDDTPAPACEWPDTDDEDSSCNYQQVQWLGVESSPVGLDTKCSFPVCAAKTPCESEGLGIPMNLASACEPPNVGTMPTQPEAIPCTAQTMNLSALLATGRTGFESQLGTESFSRPSYQMQMAPAQLLCTNPPSSSESPMMLGARENSKRTPFAISLQQSLEVLPVEAPSTPMSTWVHTHSFSQTPPQSSTAPTFPDRRTSLPVLLGSRRASERMGNFGIALGCEPGLGQPLPTSEGCKSSALTHPDFAESKTLLNQTPKSSGISGYKLSSRDHRVPIGDLLSRNGSGTAATRDATTCQGGFKSSPKGVLPPNCTTIMVRNLPLTMKQSQLLEEIDSSGFMDLYDFCYLPCCFENGEGKGFAFINFETPVIASDFVSAWHGRAYATGKLNLSAAAVQGVEANMARWSAPRQRRIRNSQLKPFVRGERD